jgi:hypothetical protein
MCTRIAGGVLNSPSMFMMNCVPAAAPMSSRIKRMAAMPRALTVVASATKSNSSVNEMPSHAPGQMSSGLPPPMVKVSPCA